MIAQIAVTLRTMQLYYHFVHNVLRGQNFIGDHQIFGKWYDDLQEDYDSVIEEAILLEGDKAACPKEQLKIIFETINSLQCIGAENNKVYFLEAMKLEKILNNQIMGAKESGLGLGTETLIGDVAKRSGNRQYIIGQRIK